MNFKKLKSQSGRSMVEMLGVLAIIGVLSVGGIAGYSLSMRRHRANQIVDHISKLALIDYGRCQKAVLDGNIGDVSRCDDISDRTSFFYDRDKTTDVGSFPSGVEHIVFPAIIETDSTGQDTVRVDVRFLDQKLCQAVASITGSDVAGCDSSVGLIIKIKQN